MSDQGGPAVKQALVLADKFRHLPEEKAAAAVAAQIRMFWDPFMQKQLRTALGRGEIVDPVLVRALGLVDN